MMRYSTDRFLLSGQMERLTSLWETLSPLNGAMFYTIKQINGYVSEKQVDLDQEDIAAQAGRRGNNYLEHKWLLEILQRGEPGTVQERNQYPLHSQR